MTCDEVGRTYDKNKKIKKKTQWTAFTQNPTEHTLAYP
jgi:hypothetical protein